MRFHARTISSRPVSSDHRARIRRRRAGASVVFGRSAKRNATKDIAYECGMLPIGEGAPRFSVKFYMVAMLFVLFDIEVVFMYPWAVQFRDLIADGPTVLASMAGFAGDSGGGLCLRAEKRRAELEILISSG